MGLRGHLAYLEIHINDGNEDDAWLIPKREFEAESRENNFVGQRKFKRVRVSTELLDVVDRCLAGGHTSYFKVMAEGKYFENPAVLDKLKGGIFTQSLSGEIKTILFPETRPAKDFKWRLNAKSLIKWAWADSKVTLDQPLAPVVLAWLRFADSL